MLLEFQIEHLDWETIKKDDDADVFKKYSRVLGIFIVLTNKETDMTQIFKVDLSKFIKDSETGKIVHEVTLHMSKAGSHKFEYIICDNFGFNYTVPLLVKA